MGGDPIVCLRGSGESRLVAGRRQVFLDRRATLCGMHNQLCQVEDPLGGERRREASFVDVGDQVALGVSMSCAGAVCEVGGQAVRGSESRAFADEQDDQARVQQFADVIQNADSTVADEEWLSQTESPFCGTGRQQRQEPGGLFDQRGGGEAVSQDDL